MYKSASQYKKDHPSRIIGLKPVMQRRVSDTEMNDHDEGLAAEKLQEAEQLIEKAKHDAENLIKQADERITKQKQAWESERHQLSDQAKKEGYLEGIEIGKQEGLKEQGRLIEEAQRVLDEAKKDYLTTLDSSEEVILELAMKAAGKIIKTELNGEAYLNIVKAAIQEVKEQKSITIYSSPEEYKLVLDQKDELQSITKGDAELSVYPDSQLKKGGCIIESPFGRIDASVDTQLIEIREKLFEISRENSDES
ncbi:flagellar assembly protein FliH [Sediminibacillus massiliensis]|uniref:flagellar assembly protein FliH n=1 Tax=Sediminibacillus massiliensis TaxID=1926277 RepID=UPI0009883CEA|nr:flagellar assembly protein FliH [Sediminibacillus massiliensis]